MRQIAVAVVRKRPSRLERLGGGICGNGSETAVVSEGTVLTLINVGSSNTVSLLVSFQLRSGNLFGV